MAMTPAEYAEWVAAQQAAERVKQGNPIRRALSDAIDTGFPIVPGIRDAWQNAQTGGKLVGEASQMFGDAVRGLGSMAAEVVENVPVGYSQEPPPPTRPSAPQKAPVAKQGIPTTTDLYWAAQAGKNPRLSEEARARSNPQLDETNLAQRSRLLPMGPPPGSPTGKAPVGDGYAQRNAQALEDWRKFQEGSAQTYALQTGRKAKGLSGKIYGGGGSAEQRQFILSHESGGLTHLPGKQQRQMRESIQRIKQEDMQNAQLAAQKQGQGGLPDAKSLQGRLILAEFDKNAQDARTVYEGKIKLLTSEEDRDKYRVTAVADALDRIGRMSDKAVQDEISSASAGVGVGLPDQTTLDMVRAKAVRTLTAREIKTWEVVDPKMAAALKATLASSTKAPAKAGKQLTPAEQAELDRLLQLQKGR
jgi:hypothetical protein